MLLNESVHNDDLGEIVGSFHGIPVRKWYAKSTAVREVVEVRRRISIRKAMEEEAPLPVLALPDHEYVDARGIICPLTQTPAVEAAA